MPVVLQCVFDKLKGVQLTQTAVYATLLNLEYS